LSFKKIKCRKNLRCPIYLDLPLFKNFSKIIKICHAESFYRKIFFLRKREILLALFVFPRWVHRCDASKRGRLREYFAGKRRIRTRVALSHHGRTRHKLWILVDCDVIRLIRIFSRIFPRGSLQVKGVTRKRPNFKRIFWRLLTSRMALTC